MILRKKEKMTRDTIEFSITRKLEHVIAKKLSTHNRYYDTTLSNCEHKSINRSKGVYQRGNTPFGYSFRNGDVRMNPGDTNAKLLTPKD